MRRQFSPPALLLLLLLAGCAGVVRPPVDVLDPATVYIADYGKHSSILLPAGSEDCYVEYAFGDWRCFVENHNSLASFIRAALVSTRSALGRREVVIDPARPNRDNAQALQTYRLLRFEVEATRAAALRADLDDRYTAAGAEPIDNPFVRLAFVPDRERYWLFNNCNHLTARWARRLGASVRGLAVTSDFSIQPRRMPPSRPEQ